MQSKRSPESPCPICLPSIAHQPIHPQQGWPRPLIVLLVLQFVSELWLLSFKTSTPISSHQWRKELALCTAEALRMLFSLLLALFQEIYCLLRPSPLSLPIPPAWLMPFPRLFPTFWLLRAPVLICFSRLGTNPARNLPGTLWTYINVLCCAVCFKLI